MQNLSKIADSATIDFFTANTDSELALTMVVGGIRAGFPSPAQDYIDLKIDLNKELIANPSSTFYGRVKGFSMQDAGVEDGDILVIDKSLEPADGDMAVCFIDGEFTLKYIKIEKDALYLIPANPAFQPIKVSDDNNFCIWGVVTYSIKNHKQKNPATSLRKNRKIKNP
jgi:DNA polymerase V